MPVKMLMQVIFILCFFFLRHVKSRVHAPPKIDQTDHVLSLLFLNKKIARVDIPMHYSQFFQLSEDLADLVEYVCPPLRKVAVRNVQLKPFLQLNSDMALHNPIDGMRIQAIS